MVGCRLAGEVSHPALARAAGLRRGDLHIGRAGKYLPTGSERKSLPSSCRIMTPTETIGLVIEAIEKIASPGIVILASGSRKPTA